ncbi:MAG: GyrI-like domain-containing protein [Desulfobacterales bacterium]|nr:GyrI-like domain-containing protein [Desulfobacterales bacterium]
MEKVNLPSFELSGVSVRTNGANETQPETARIGDLWQQFFNDVKIPPKTAYGLYTEYENQDQEDYTVIAGLAGEYPSPQAVSITVPSGRYLKFETQGPLPQACMALWQKIWEFFGGQGAPKRKFKCDFEEYSQGGTCLAIYVGIEE